MIDQTPPRKDWGNIVFLTLTPILGIPVLAWYTIQTGFEWWMLLLFLGMYSMVGLSVCAGYHRYFSHKSFECAKPVQFLLAVTGAMSAQNSILCWSSGHRRHHAHSETEWDPYSIKRGFWWAHIIWIFYVDPNANKFENVRDLQKSKIVMWQHRWYKTILFVVGFGVPTLIGACFGNPIAGLLWGGFLRIVVVHHSTFFVNSLSHHMGTPTYDASATARDNWFVALLTFGEGYHSFHHRFPADFRNGIRWYCWDPAKWLINSLKLVGLAWSLNETEAPRIEQARMKEKIKALEPVIASADHTLGSEIRARIQVAHNHFDTALALLKKLSEERRDEFSKQWLETRRNYRIRLKSARREWREVLQACKDLNREKCSP
jgi:stearoyl-CoA desaturase (Delta-9 desaturase)